MERKVKIGDREFVVREIKYKDLVEAKTDEDKSGAAGAKKLMLLATDMTEEEYSDLSLKAGILIQKEINELNGLEDFQKLLNK